MDDAEIGLRAREMQPFWKRCESTIRGSACHDCHLLSVESHVREISEPLARMKEWLRETGAMSEASLRTERGFTLLDGQSSAVDEQLRVAVERFLHEETQGD